MSNTALHFRTNYFRVKDKKAFFNAISKFKGGFKTVDGDDDSIAIFSLSPLGNEWPAGYHDDSNTFVPADFASQVALHLADAEVVVFMITGYDGVSHKVIGRSIALNNRLQHVSIDLHDIATHVQSLTDDVKLLF